MRKPATSSTAPPPTPTGIPTSTPRPIPTRAGLTDSELASHVAINQMYSQIEEAHGPNACGLVALANALKTTDNSQSVLALIESLRWNATYLDSNDRTVYAYQPFGDTAGIQPSFLHQTLNKTFPSLQAQVKNNWNATDMFWELLDQKIIIVDFKVNRLGLESTITQDTVAHFARVLSIDHNQNKIFIERTLGHDQPNKMYLTGRESYWEISLTTFEDILWRNPETSADFVVTNAEPVDRWALVIHP